MPRLVLGILLSATFCAAAAVEAFAHAPPPDLYSQRGVLSVTFNYLTGVDSAGRTLF
jgi:hypothetical protein